MENTQETKTSAAKRIAIVVLLGAVGSGVWTLVGEPLIQGIGSGAVRLMSWFSTAYLESIYAEIGKGLYERNASLLHSSFSGFYIGFWTIIPITIYLRWKKLAQRISTTKGKLDAIENGTVSQSPTEDETPEKILADSTRFARKLRIFFWLLVVTAPIAITLQLASLYRSLYTSSAVVYLERSIEILAPHINSAEHLQLRASYRAIENRDQFIVLNQQILGYAKSKSVRLPPFSPL